MILFDSGAWIALSVPNDRNAKVAQGVYADTARGVHGRIVTTDFILDEAARALNTDLVDELDI